MMLLGALSLLPKKARHRASIDTGGSLTPYNGGKVQVLRGRRWGLPELQDPS